MSGQLRKLKSAQAELLKTFVRHPIDVKGHFAKNTTMSAEKAYRCFFETYDKLEEKIQPQRQLLKQNYLEKLGVDSEQKLDENNKTLKWLFEQITKFEELKEYRSYDFNYRRHFAILRLSEKMYIVS